jgi:putative membrane protein
MTKNPALSGIAFLWMGLIGVFSLPMMFFRKAPIYRTFATIGLLIAALLWAIIGYAAYWDHLKPFSAWKPVSLKYEMDMQQTPAAH